MLPLIQIKKFGLGIQSVWKNKDGKWGEEKVIPIGNLKRKNQSVRLSPKILMLFRLKSSFVRFLFILYSIIPFWKLKKLQLSHYLFAEPQL